MRLPDLTMGEHLPERTAGTPVVVRYDSPSDGEPVGHEPLERLVRALVEVAVHVDKAGRCHALAGELGRERRRRPFALNLANLWSL